jgi:hypothetical protein
VQLSNARGESLVAELSAVGFDLPGVRARRNLRDVAERSKALEHVVVQLF